MPLRVFRASRLLLTAVALACLLPAAVRAVTVPAQFVVENAASGAPFNLPTGMAFLPDGRFLVSEKGGSVWMVRNGARLATKVWDGSAEVLDDGDRGLSGVAVSPNYFVDRFVFFLYCVDPDSNGVDATTPSFNRVTRYRMHATGDTNTVDLTSRAILIGVDWSRGIPSPGTSHGAGSLRFGTDGSLLVSSGDGAEYDVADAGGRVPAAFGDTRTDPYADIGAFRSQDITILAGKILRINPVTGHGYASNPYADSNLRSVRSRVWTYGLRNPFRFAVRPGTGSADTAAASPGSLYAGDVGWYSQEEVSVARTPGANMGWPCSEGLVVGPGFRTATPAHNDCNSVGAATNPAPWQAPTLAWDHANQAASLPPGTIGVAALGGVFYSGVNYPAQYQGRYFYADYVGGWINVATFSAGDNLISADDFATQMETPVDFALHPVTKDIHYVSIDPGLVRRIRYTGSAGGNAPPVAQAVATPSAGLAPLVVSFSGANSFDPEGAVMTYEWAFGDGGTATTMNPNHLYASAGSYIAALTVTDAGGATGQSQVTVVPYATVNFPTTGVLDAFSRANGPLGPSWLGETQSVQVLGNQMQLVAPDASIAFGDSVFGPDQECHVIVRSLAPAAIETDLLLKMQGTSWASGTIEVWYDAPAQSVRVETYEPVAGWVSRGLFPGVTLAAGDQFGARAFANGSVEVFRNSARIGEVSVIGWPYAALGGRIGLAFVNALNETLDDFGGGNWSPDIGMPLVTVIGPNGSESILAGSPRTIAWTATDDGAVANVDIYYREGPDAAWAPLAIAIPNTGSFTWYVHNTPGTTMRVRVVAHDNEGNVAEDTSNSDFTVITPAGGRVATTLRDFHMPGTQPLGTRDFQDHNTCFTCHGGFNAAVEPGRTWRGTMMAQAARDPLFYACLAIAEQDAPSSGDMCIRCHSPGAWLGGRSQPTNGSRIEAHDRDGVSCDFCHRLVDPVYQPGVSPPEDEAVLGGLLPAHRPSGHSNGQYVVDDNVRRRGPYADPETPHTFLKSAFHESSDLCGTCHDVSNPVFDRIEGADYGPGPLDAPAAMVASHALMPLERTFSEWKNSEYPAGVIAPEFAGNAPGGLVSSCQSCHMREVSGQGCNSGSAPVRPDLPTHDFTGGNTWMGGVIASLYPGEVDATALAEGAARAEYMLQRAAQLQMWVTAEGDSSVASVKIFNQTGHKLPTGYPEGRRMWLNVRARDLLGNIVYESGAYDPATGVLVDDPQIKVYEAKLGISPGLAPLLGLPQGPSFHFVANDTLYKDNRIPPRGFTNAAFEAFGGAPVDPHGPVPRYADGQYWDVATYTLPAGAHLLTATLYYQSTSKEYIEFLRDANTTNNAGQVAYDAWVANGRAAPVVMARDSLVFHIVGVQAGDAPAVLALRTGQNPFRDGLDLSLSLPGTASVELEVVDVAGRAVYRSGRRALRAGEHRLQWNGRDRFGHDSGAGVFWAVVHIDGRRLVRRVVRLR